MLLTSMGGRGGGIEAFNRSLLRAMGETADGATRITALSLNDAAGTLPNLRLNKTDLRGFGRRRVAFCLAALRSAASASTVIAGHCNLAPLLLGVSAPRRMLVLHGTEAWRKLARLTAWGSGRATNVASVSRYTAGQFAALNGTDAGSIADLPDTLDPEFACGTQLFSREELGLPSGPLILSVSRLSPDDSYKNLNQVICAMPRVRERVPDAHYVIVGEGADRPRLAAIARDAGVAEVVHFTGFVAPERLLSYYQLCDVFVLPSLGEGFGIVFLEAMLFGKPCIGARAAAVPEVVEHGVSGWLCDPAALGEIHMPIADLLLNAELRARLGAAGRQRLAERFSYDKFRARVARWVWNQ